MSAPVTIPEAVRRLPIAEVVHEVSDALCLGNVVLQAAPGAGKSTGLPLALLSNATPANRIVMLEPRRLAALGVAERLAMHSNESLGQRIGLRMRGRTLVSRCTCLEVVTEGVLTRMLQADPTMEGVGLIIFDEFHERSLHADLGLALSLEVQQALRDDLRLLLMSATLDAVELIGRIKGIKQISCAGRAHPVELRWQGNSKEDLVVRVAATINTALSKEQGDVLVFLPGIAEIEKIANIVGPRLASGQVLYRLYSGADANTQRAATAPVTPGQQRIILSTSIAETSITIDGVRVVIDAGLERRARIDNSTGAQRLETVMASQASATQRAGRAGRTSSGVCYRLWSEDDHARRTVSWQAEILRADLCAVVMELGQWGAADTTDLPWLDPPPQAGIARAQSLLTRLGIWKEGRLTEHGSAVSRIPLHPRLGNMVLWAAKHGVVKSACHVAVVLEESRLKTGGIDLEVLLQHSVPQRYKQRMAQIKKVIFEALDKQNTVLERAENLPSLGVLLAQAYPDWIAKRRPGGEARYVLSCGAGVFVAVDDPLAHNAWLAVASMGGASQEPRVFLGCALDINELMAWSPEFFSSVKKLEWDDRRERVVAEQQQRLGTLIVNAKTITQISDEEKAQALLDGVRKRGITCLPWNDETRQWQVRVLMMSRLNLDNKRSHNAPPSDVFEKSVTHNWPRVDDETLLDELENWLLVWLHGKSSLKALAQLDLLTILKAMLDHQQQQLLDAMLPVRYTVPSGSKIKLRYAEGDSPVLSVKLQEMFGCTLNPSVANGNVVLKVELLSPARRPIQLTTDLVNFWNGSYAEVKKDMAGRYPKHDWPDDPTNAKPTANAKRRKS